ncbi:DUF6286 domain-containing protein [Thermoactinospora rubra]|uniref:DUF6286 domain-containing protein n=1 Tax=Thermoactinospora rubra TaxID=1088767 RepID=UPI00117C4AC3|nr:DUF6286 domain-containing protein [Thermoactinospora rubra]
MTTALTLTAALGLTAAEVISTLLDAPLGWVPVDRLVELAAESSWKEASLPAMGLAAAGALLLLHAVLPGRSRLVPLETGDPLVVVGITRAGLRRTLRAVAQGVDGVGKARVRLRGRLIEVTVVTGSESQGSPLRKVGTAVGDRLAALGAGGDVVVRLRRKGI